MATINIQPIPGFYNGKHETLTAIKFERLGGYHFDDQGANVRYLLTSESGEEITGGSCPIPAEIMDAWTDDDNTIFNYIFEQLNLIRA